MVSRSFAQLMSDLGYPGTDAQSVGRIVWSGSQSQIPHSRICSAFSTAGAVSVTSPEIRQIVKDVYSKYLTLPEDWTPQQRTEFLESESLRISRRLAELAAEMGEQYVVDWTAANGRAPDYMTHAGLLNTAMSAAREVVLQDELYEQIPVPDDSMDELEPVVDRSLVPWDQRWTRLAYRSDPDETLEALAETVWPDPQFSAVFRIKAGYLLAARAEDLMPLPSRPGEDLATELAAMVYADLRSDGLPER